MCLIPYLPPRTMNIATRKCSLFSLSLSLSLSLEREREQERYVTKSAGCAPASPKNGFHTTYASGECEVHYDCAPPMRAAQQVVSGHTPQHIGGIPLQAEPVASTWTRGNTTTS
jgi:hypothetical protein